MVQKTVFFSEGKYVSKIVFLDFIVQKDLVLNLVGRGYDCIHEPNGFVRLEKRVFVKK